MKCLVSAQKLEIFLEPGYAPESIYGSGVLTKGNSSMYEILGLPGSAC